MTSDERRDRSEPESLRLRSITPGLTVDDLDASLAFYRDVLGFTVSEVFEHDGKVGGYNLIAGSSHLFIAQDDWAKGKDRKKGVAVRLYFSTAQSVDDLAARIKSQGFALASEPQDMPWGSRAFSLLDPNGFAITVTSDG